MRDVRVMIADDQPEVRSAIRLVLEQQGVVVVAEPDEVGSVASEAIRTRPDILLLDWELPGAEPCTGEMRLRRLSRLVAAARAASPGIRVVAMSGRSGARAEAVACGADEFLSKAGPARLLLGVLDRQSDSHERRAHRKT